jgi:hypothetical protein
MVLKLMNIFIILQIDDTVDIIDLIMTPIVSFGLFECRDDMLQVRGKKERYYYFYVNN